MRDKRRAYAGMWKEVRVASVGGLGDVPVTKVRDLGGAMCTVEDLNL